MHINVVASFLRLGNKYEIEILRASALKRLFHDYPTRIEGVCPVKRKRMIFGTKWLDIDVANLAREQNLLSLLPIALYYCCEIHSGKDLVNGIPRNDGTRAKLLRCDETTCLISLQPLIQLQAETTWAWLYLPADAYFNCETIRSNGRCRQIRQAIRDAIFPSCSLRGVISWDRQSDGAKMCDKCNEKARVIHDDGRIKFWNALPGIFGLPEW